MSATNTPKKQISALKGWFTMPPEEPRLIGSKCKSCGHRSFPAAMFCRNPNCTKTEGLEEIKLSRRGKLWTYTIMYYPPPFPYRAPDPYIPFGIAVVVLEDGLRIQGQVASGTDLQTLKVGMDMEVVLEKLYDDNEGNEVLAWKFRPV
ncbi:Zn-ribbon domain-containing OB-fold protein [Chloroflexota bacterium]